MREMSGRDTLEKYWLKRTEEEKQKYWQTHNLRSIDGLPTGIAETTTPGSETPSRNRR
jgi:hypothetical protein